MVSEGRKKDQQQESTYLGNIYKRILNFMGTKQFIYSSLGLIGSGMGLYLAKSKLYDNFKSYTEVEKLISSGVYSSCLFGNLFFIGYLKQKGGFDISVLPEESSSIL